MEDLNQYIREARSGSSLAYFKVVQLCEDKVFTVCYRIIGNREEAEEAAQDVFINCFQKIGSLEDDSKFLPWLLKISYNKSIDYVRRKKIKHQELKHEKLESQSSRQHKDEREEDELNRYLSVCDESEKTIITLYYQEDMSTQEIADILQLTKSNVKIKLFRARNKIKKFIEENDKN